MAATFLVNLTETRVYFKSAYVTAETEADARRMALQSGPWQGESQVLHDTIRSVTGATRIKSEIEIRAEMAELQAQLDRLQKGFAAKPAKVEGRITKGSEAYRLRMEGKTWQEVAEILGMGHLTYARQNARSAALRHAKAYGLTLR